MSKKAMVLFSVWTSFWVMVFFTVYNFTPIQPLGWVMFVVLTLYLVTGYKPQQVLGAAACLACGLLWGQLYLLAIGWMAGLGIDYNVAFAIGVLVVTIASIVVHMVLLGDTFLGTTPYIFAGVFLTFSPAGADLPGTCITLACGLALAVLSVLGMNWLIKRFPEERSATEQQA